MIRPVSRSAEIDGDRPRRERRRSPLRSSQKIICGTMRVLCLAAVLVSTTGLLQGTGHGPRRYAASIHPRIIRAVADSIVPQQTEKTAMTDTRSKDRLHIRIDDEWYDLTNWRAAHPAGAHWIDAYKNSDATEVRAKTCILIMEGSLMLCPLSHVCR